MATQSILINYVGYPVAPRVLIPDNGLANLAACLIAAGHRTLILDYCTVDIIERLYPHHLRDRLSGVLESLPGESVGSRELSVRDQEKFHSLGKEFEKHETGIVREIAAEVVEHVRCLKPDFVGFKLWTGAGFQGSMVIAGELRRHFPDLRIFAGGAHVDWFGPRIFQVTDAFPVLAYGEGEETISLLAEYVEGKARLENIPGLIYRTNARVVTTPPGRVTSLDNLPPAVYSPDVYPALEGDQKIKMAAIDESRGCPSSCSFCIHPIKSGRRQTRKSPPKMAAQMERVANENGMRVFRFAGSNPPPDLTTGIAQEILRRKLSIGYASFGHVRGGTSQDFDLLRKSGCQSLFFGVESGNQRILDEIIKKRITIEQVRETFRRCRSSGIASVASVIVPAPGETPETMQESLDLMLEIRPDAVFVAAPLVIQGTEWGRDPGRYGIDIPDPDLFYREQMMYTIKSFYPPALWPPFPYFRVNQKSFRELIADTESFVHELESKDLLTQVTCDTILLAKCAGMSPRQFRDQTRRHLLTGDFSEMRELVRKINQGVNEGAWEKAGTLLS